MVMELILPHFRSSPTTSRFGAHYPSALKTLPIWNEIEQMLDNPYNLALCSSLPASVDPLVRNTPGTTQIWSVQADG